MTDEILGKLDSLQAGQEAIRQDLAELRSEMRDELSAIRREANQRQEIHLQILEAVAGSRPSGLRQAG